MKRCARCGLRKPRTEFYANRPSLSSYCRPCAAINTKENTLRKRYGLTLAEYDRLLDAQDGACAICRTPPGGRLLAVDHNHDTGKVRGLLCLRCNTGIGQLRDNPDLMDAAITYLRYGYLPT